MHRAARGPSRIVVLAVQISRLRAQVREHARMAREDRSGATLHLTALRVARRSMQNLQAEYRRLAGTPRRAEVLPLFKGDPCR